MIPRGLNWNDPNVETPPTQPSPDYAGLIQRLRKAAPWYDQHPTAETGALLSEAAEAIEALTAARTEPHA